MDLPRLDRRNISDEVYDVLKAKIISQELAPGERLSLNEMEKQLNVSRTPLKDALNRLSVEGLIDILPRRGTFVSSPTVEEMAEAFDVRAVLEAYATELAIPRMKEQHLDRVRGMVESLRRMVDTGDWNSIYQGYVSLDHGLHRFTIELSGNKRLLWVYDRLNVHAQMARVRYLQAEEELDIAQQEHEEILRAFEARDVKAASVCIKKHIERAKVSLLRDMVSERQHQPEQAVSSSVSSE